MITLLDDMAETMIDANGLGLAGPQVGVMRRLFVALEEPPEPAEGEEPVPYEQWKVLEFINPEVVEAEGEARGYEGCLSFPGRYAAIQRPARATVRAFDRHGNPFTYSGEAMMARCLCHETDHLNGVTIDELAEYFYDPEVPHDLDETLGGHGEGDEGADGAENSAEE